MMFLAEFSNSGTAGDPAKHLEAEAARSRELLQSGVFERLLVRSDNSGAFILLHAEDETAARNILATMPLVIAGISTIKLTEVFDPAQ